MTTSDPTAFVLRMLEADEAAARIASGPEWTVRDRDDRYFFVASDTRAIASAEHSWDRAHIARHDPARVLAQCAAIRAVVAEHEIAYQSASDEVWGNNPECGTCNSWPCPTLRALSTIWRDHEDFDEGWAL